jgi:hypothetical protein
VEDAFEFECVGVELGAAGFAMDLVPELVPLEEWVEAIDGPLEDGGEGDGLEFGAQAPLFFEEELFEGFEGGL